MDFLSSRGIGTGEEECPAEWWSKASRLYKGTEVELQRRRRRIDQRLVLEARWFLEQQEHVSAIS